MLRWSINLFRVFGIQLAVHASFVLLLAYYAVNGWLEGRWVGMVWRVILITSFFVCVVLHELGHSLTARRFGVKISRILLMPIGGMAEFDHIPRKPSAEVLITIAGPAVNFLIALPLIPFFWHSLVNDAELAPWSIARLGFELLIANLVMGTFNLLPVFPMDGGRIFRAVLAIRLPYLRATFWAARIGQVLAVALACLAAFYWQNVMMAVLFAFIFTVAGAEYRNLLRQEQLTARWAELAKPVFIPVTSADDNSPLPPKLVIHGPN